MSGQHCKTPAPRASRLGARAIIGGAAMTAVFIGGGTGVALAAGGSPGLEQPKSQGDAITKAVSGLSDSNKKLYDAALALGKKPLDILKDLGVKVDLPPLGGHDDKSHQPDKGHDKGKGHWDNHGRWCPDDKGHWDNKGRWCPDDKGHWDNHGRWCPDDKGHWDNHGKWCPDDDKSKDDKNKDCPPDQKDDSKDTKSDDSKDTKSDDTKDTKSDDTKDATSDDSTPTVEPISDSVSPASNGQVSDVPTGSADTGDGSSQPALTAASSGLGGDIALGGGIAAAALLGAYGVQMGRSRRAGAHRSR